jgi:hypothetical protein
LKVGLKPPNSQYSMYVTHEDKKKYISEHRALTIVVKKFDELLLPDTVTAQHHVTTNIEIPLLSGLETCHFEPTRQISSSKYVHILSYRQTIAT